MTILLMLIPFALGLAGAFILAFAWSAYSGQWDDIETPAHRILIDDDPA